MRARPCPITVRELSIDHHHWTTLFKKAPPTEAALLRLVLECRDLAIKLPEFDIEAVDELFLRIQLRRRRPDSQA